MVSASRFDSGRAFATRCQLGRFVSGAVFRSASLIGRVILVDSPLESATTRDMESTVEFADGS